MRHIWAPRAAEVCNLKVSDIDSDRMLIHVELGKPAATTKQRREHRVPLSSMASGVLQERRAMLDALPQDDPLRLSGFVFPGDEGRALVDVKRTWAAVSKAAGLSNSRATDAQSAAPHDRRARQ